MDRGAQVEGLQSAPAGIPVGESASHGIENVVVGADRTAHDQVAGIFQRLADLLAAGNFAHAGMAGVVVQDHEIAGEKWRMGAAQIEQHAVLSGHGDDLHLGDDRRCGG